MNYIDGGLRLYFQGSMQLLAIPALRSDLSEREFRCNHNFSLSFFFGMYKSVMVPSKISAAKPTVSDTVG